MVSVAIDGPAGAGKSTLARRLAAELGYIYVDTGAMYRAIGLYALRAGKDPKDNAAVDALLPEIELRLASIAGEQHIYLKDEDVSTAIRTEAAGMAASAVGANPAVRAFLLDLQRSMAKKQDVLMDGRDIGTVVLPVRWPIEIVHSLAQVPSASIFFKNALTNATPSEPFGNPTP